MITDPLTTAQSIAPPLPAEQRPEAASAGGLQREEASISQAGRALLEREDAERERAAQVDAQEAERNSEQAERQDPETEDAEETTREDPNAPRGRDGEALNEAEQARVEELKRRDREVRTHEQAHIAAAGGLARGGASYGYQSGPDGKRYATSGEVQIDSSEASSPEATIAKMEVVRRAALAPAEPSAQDRQVASQATQNLLEARRELREAQQEERAKTIDTDEAERDAAGRAADDESDGDAKDRQQLRRSYQLDPQIIAQRALGF